MTSKSWSNFPVKPSSNYFDRLRPWVISRVVYDNRIVLGRFRNVSDARGHLEVLQRRYGSQAHFTITYEDKK